MANNQETNNGDDAGSHVLLTDLWGVNKMRESGFIGEPFQVFRKATTSARKES